MEDDQGPTAAAELRVELKSVAMPLPQVARAVMVVLDITFPPGGELVIPAGDACS
jgi:hypothetical protein